MCKHFVPDNQVKQGCRPTELGVAKLMADRVVLDTLIVADVENVGHSLARGEALQNR